MRSPRSDLRISDFSRLTGFGARMVSIVMDGARKQVGAYPSHCIRSMKNAMSSWVMRPARRMSITRCWISPTVLSFHGRS